MFSRISAAFFYLLVAFTVLAAAMPGGGNPPVTVTVTAYPGNPTTPASQCNTGPIQCCNSVQSASAPAVALLAGLLGIVISDITALVGLTCTPITVIGGSGNSCSAQPVCCTNNDFDGLIVIGCSPVNINL
ncbi:POH2 hydrophobin [Lyophyllum atratum]|nr:POH2 hydrophobin [Lyophyllum atratum]